MTKWAICFIVLVIAGCSGNTNNVDFSLVRAGERNPFEFSLMKRSEVSKPNTAPLEFLLFLRNTGAKFINLSLQCTVRVDGNKESTVPIQLRKTTPGDGLAYGESTSLWLEIPRSSFPANVKKLVIEYHPEKDDSDMSSLLFPLVFEDDGGLTVLKEGILSSDQKNPPNVGEAGKIPEEQGK